MISKESSLELTRCQTCIKSFQSINKEARTKLIPPVLAIPACCMYALQTIMAVPRYFIRVTRGRRPGGVVRTLCSILSVHKTNFWRTDCRTLLGVTTLTLSFFMFTAYNQEETCFAYIFKIYFFQ